ncbi:MAG: secondary thiamine-phosphate synthase enzyme YjbQ [Anaerolineae bacterium]|jgi:secondary thiamine-phosphate synthase enzyme|nr:secondary thiamine-phosphate synthase enzyme YjbQ [Anaerolineae bacterium]
MKIILQKIEIQSRKGKELIDLTPQVERVVEESGVKEGLVNVLTMHTSSGIIVTEGLPCLEMDVLNHLDKLAPDQGNYYHNRYLEIDGRLGFNAGAHLRSIIGGIQVSFPIEGGHIVRGSRQRIYFAEYDGPLARTCCIQILGQ